MAVLQNAKHEKYIQNIVAGMSQRQAYKDVYKNNMTDKQVDEEACKLFNSPKINQRYKELLEQLEEEAIMSTKERMKWLTKVVNGDIQEEAKYYDDGEMVVYEKPADISTKIKALDTLNKMSGEYTTKIEGNVGVTNIRVDIDE